MFLLQLFVVIFSLFLARWGVRVFRKRRNTKLLNTVTASDRGTRSERELVLSLLKSGRSPKALYHDLMLEKERGGYSQIDAVLATKVGIIVFEVKDYIGWIYGNCGHAKWTQVTAYGQSKYRFYNPVKQNEGHIKSLKATLRNAGMIPYYSVVVFDGDCSLKEIDYVPKNTYVVKANRVNEVIRDIELNHPKADYQDKTAVVRILEQAVIRGANPEILDQHRGSIDDMLGQSRVYD